MKGSVGTRGHDVRNLISYEKTHKRGKGRISRKLSEETIRSIIDNEDFIVLPPQCFIPSCGDDRTNGFHLYFDYFTQEERIKALRQYYEFRNKKVNSYLNKYKHFEPLQLYSSDIIELKSKSEFPCDNNFHHAARILKQLC